MGLGDVRGDGDAVAAIPAVGLNPAQGAESAGLASRKARVRYGAALH